MRSHQGLKPFVCNECGAQFTMKANFKRHVEEHSGQRYISTAFLYNKIKHMSPESPVFRIRIRMDPHSIGRLDPDPGGLKRTKMKKITQLKDR
jgi:uncharacterized Zn-finger protein